MKANLKYILLIFTCVLSGIVSAQDVHWSQFFDNPLLYNPSNAGNFKGNARFHLNYRDQWRSVTKPFSSFSFSYDTRFTKKREVGLGLSLLNDASGDGKFKTLEIQVSPSYEKILEKDSSKVFAFGAQLALNQRNFSFSKYYFDEQYNGTNYDPNLPITESLTTDKKTNLSIGIGTRYSHRFDRKKNLTVGLSLFNINRPNQGFYGEKVKRDMRLSVIVSSEIKLKDKLSLLPSILFQRQGKYTEIILGSRLKYTLKQEEKTYTALYAGLFFRTKDAIFFNAGLDYNSWSFGLSYDVNLSTLVPASAARGGIEIVTKYVINRFKPKQIQHRICPEYI